MRATLAHFVCFFILQHWESAVNSVWRIGLNVFISFGQFVRCYVNVP